MGGEGSIQLAVKALIIRDGRFLAMHKAGIQSDRLELPGGRMVFGETAEQTVVREVMEETGLNIKPVHLVDTWNYVTGHSQITGIIYLCVVQGSGDVRLSEEHDSYEWLLPTPEAIARMNRLFRPQMQTWAWEDLLRD